MLLCWGGAFADDYIDLIADAGDDLEWDWDTDEFGGSSVEPIAQNPPEAKLTLGAEPDDEDSDDWPWLYIALYDFGIKTMATLEKINVSYTASPSRTIFVSIPTTHKFGGEDVSYQARLSSGQDIRLSSFTPPEWMLDEGYDGPSTLADVEKDDIKIGISFSHENYGEAVTLKLTSLKLYGVEWEDDGNAIKETNKKAQNKMADFAVKGISAGKLNLHVPSAGSYSIAIFGVNGKMLVKTKANLVQGANTLAINKNLAKGIAIVRVSGANATLVKKISVK